MCKLDKSIDNDNSNLLRQVNSELLQPLLQSKAPFTTNKKLNDNLLSSDLKVNHKYSLLTTSKLKPIY